MKCRGAEENVKRVRGADCEVEVSGLDVGAARNSWKFLRGEKHEERGNLDNLTNRNM